MSDENPATLQVIPRKKGRVVSEETRRKISIANKGYNSIESGSTVELSAIA